MNQKLIQFILSHENEDVNTLLLKYKELYGYSITYVVDQINGRRRSKNKLPSWYAHPEIEYPPQINLEQCSSEVTAEYKTQIIAHSPSLNSIADLTGGFGVDTYYFSKIFKEVIYVEPNEKLAKATQGNHKILGGQNINYVISSAEDYLKKCYPSDWLYIDPSRKSNGKKVFKFSDCEPDLIEVLPQMFAVTNNILVKASPLLDIKAGCKELNNVSKVYIVSVQNECKEVLFVLMKNITRETSICCVNLLSTDSLFEFDFRAEENATADYSEPLEFIYEPNASILKAGAFKSIAQHYNLKKIDIHTHFYTHDKLIDSFPGRIFKSSGAIKEKSLRQTSFNIISRNHPLTPEQIKRKYKLNDGGDQYLLAFSSSRKKYIIQATRLK